MWRQGIYCVIVLDLEFQLSAFSKTCNMASYWIIFSIFSDSFEKGMDVGTLDMNMDFAR